MEMKYVKSTARLLNRVWVDKGGLDLSKEVLWVYVAQRRAKLPFIKVGSLGKKSAAEFYLFVLIVNYSIKVKKTVIYQYLSKPTLWIFNSDLKAFIECMCCAIEVSYDLRAIFSALRHVSPISISTVRIKISKISLWIILKSFRFFWNILESFKILWSV